MSKIVKAGFRNVKQKVRTAKGRKTGSTKWIERHINDPYVLLSKQDGYRSRAAYKLLEILSKEKEAFSNAKLVIDLGCAPGSWLQVLTKKTKAKIIGIDLQNIEALEGVTFFQGDFLDDDFMNSQVMPVMVTQADIILSDMAASASGDPQNDHFRICELIEKMIEFSDEHLRSGGLIAFKMLKGKDEQMITELLKARFEKFYRLKPKASYQDSAEFFVVARGFKPKDK